jgi:hypothetical protein
VNTHDQWIYIIGRQYAQSWERDTTEQMEGDYLWENKNNEIVLFRFI